MNRPTRRPPNAPNATGAHGKGTGRGSPSTLETPVSDSTWYTQIHNTGHLVERLGPHRVYVETDAEQLSCFMAKPPAEDHICLPNDWREGLALQYQADPRAWCEKHNELWDGELPMVRLIHEMERGEHLFCTGLAPGRRAFRLWQIGRRLAECQVHAYHRPVGEDVVYLTPEPCPEHVRQVGPDWTLEAGWWLSNLTMEPCLSGSSTRASVTRRRKPARTP